MKDTVLVGLVALIFSVSQLCTGNAIIPQASQSEGPTHDEDVSDLLQNLLPSSEDHVLQLPFGQESQSPGSDVIMRVLTVVNKELAANRKVHDNDVARLNNLISLLSSDVREIKDKLAALAKTTTLDPSGVPLTNGNDDDVAATQSERRTTSAEGLAAGKEPSGPLPSTGTIIPDRPPEKEDRVEESDASGDTVAESAGHDDVAATHSERRTTSADGLAAGKEPSGPTPSTRTSITDRPHEKEVRVEESDASGDTDAETAQDELLTLTSHTTPPVSSRSNGYTRWKMGRLDPYSHYYRHFLSGLGGSSYTRRRISQLRIGRKHQPLYHRSALETTTRDPPQGVFSTGDNDVTATQSERRTTSADGLAAGKEPSGPSPSTVTSIQDRPPEKEDRVEESDASGDTDVEAADELFLTSTRQTTTPVTSRLRRYSPRMTLYRALRLTLQT